MERKFIIFVVFASLAQCSFAQSVDVTYGLSEGALANFSRIISYQNETLRAKFDAANPIFDIIEKYLFIYINGFGAPFDDHFSQIDEARSRAKDAIVYYLDGVQIMTGRSCSAFKPTRKTIYANTDDFYASVANALELALYGDYSANRAQIEIHQAQARKAVEDFVNNIYNLLSTCMNTRDSDAKAVVQRFKNGSDLSLNLAVNAIFSAIKVYAAKDTGKIASESLISVNEYLRNQALMNLRTDVVNQFSASRTFFLYAKLNKTGILPALAANQNFQSVSEYKFQAAAHTIFDTIRGHLTRVDLGIYDDGEDDFSAADAAQATALPCWKVAQHSAVTEPFLESVILSNQQIDTKTVAATREILFNAEKGIIAAYFNGIRTAQAASKNYSVSLDKIATFQESQIAEDIIYIGTAYDIIRNGKHLDGASGAQFTTIRNAAVNGSTVSKSIFGAIRILAEACYAGKTSEDDFSAIRTMQAATNAAIVAYGQGVSAAEVIVLQAANSN